MNISHMLSSWHECGSVTEAPVAHVATRWSCRSVRDFTPRWCRTERSAQPTHEVREDEDFIHYYPWIWGIWIDCLCSLSRPTGSVPGQCGLGIALVVHEDAVVGSSPKLRLWSCLLLKHVLLMSAADLEAITAHWVWSGPGSRTFGPTQGGRDSE